MREALLPDRIFDGERFLSETVLLLEAGKIAGLCHKDAVQECHVTRLSGTICAGFVDLQVNGGGGVMLDGASSAETIAQICAAHAGQGATTILPTLITDTPQATRAVIAAAIAHGGLVGLHLEGPHLDPRRTGAHDPALIRPMTEADLALYLEAAQALPLLKITLSPASVTLQQVQILSRAGVLVALGHSECSYAEAQAYHAAGAQIVTHLYNAMSQLGSRAPGLVGAALDLPFYAGLIADGLHVHPASAMAALRASDRIFLVSDAMAVAGSDLEEFALQGRRILRRHGRLTLEDGTLAGADLSLAEAVANVMAWGIAPERALAMATRLPADVIGRADLGRIAMGARADFVLLDEAWRLKTAWKDGQPL